tara:strand:- start:67 stop:189 length:123 start_codon:yes stop_codon:yes gene_type:complete
MRGKFGTGADDEAVACQLDLRRFGMDEQQQLAWDTPRCRD